MTDPLNYLNNNSKNLLRLIGNTPLVELSKLNPNPKVKIFAKLEGQNPGGSVKDRPALSMIYHALKRKIITPNTQLIEPTSGNTGIALAMISRLFNLQIELVMPENSSIERVKMMESFGAKVTLTSATRQMEGAIDYVKEILEKNPNRFHMLDQFSNPDNPLAHFKNTGPEIWKDTNGEITHFVSSMGTTGTITGTSEYLKTQNKNIKIIGAQPDEGSSIPGIRRWPKEYLPKIYTEKNIDDKVNISEAQAIETMKKLSLVEGISCGPSSGGTAAIALQTAEKIESGVIVFIVCDRGDRYLSINY